MSDYLTNPFTEAYVTHTLTEQIFARYFSPVLVSSAEEIFQTGNVIVRGTQGSGKSMLLRLLDPEIRIAYHDMAQNGKEEPFPIPQQFTDFVSARVDLNKSGLLDIVNTLHPKPSTTEIQALAFAFGDFLNFWLLRGLLNNIERIKEHNDVFDNLVNNQEELDVFAMSFAKEDCFFGSLENVKNWDSLKQLIKDRVISYRAWANGNRELPNEIEVTKTSIGEPLARAAKLLHTTKVFSRTVNVFCSIDQIEALWLQSETKRSIGSVLRREIHELLGKRDNRVFYRIGVRRHDWDKDGNLAMRDGRSLEEERDFLLTDIDELLRRGECAKYWPFRKLTQDVFKRRVLTVLEDVADLPEGLENCSTFFGSSPEPQELVSQIIKKPQSSELLKLDDEWPEDWSSKIIDIFNCKVEKLPAEPSEGIKNDPLNALLLTAWGLQTGGQGKAMAKQRRFRESAPSDLSEAPWNSSKKYWRKERYPQAILQLTSRHKQKLLWWGNAKVLSLSGGNILRFITICRVTWDYWQRLDEGSVSSAKKMALIKPSTQASAILEASRKIHESLKRQPGNPGGDVRIRFLDEVAKWLRNRMLDDAAMSYPGGNGFSLRTKELAQYPKLKQLIHEAVGWGDLYEREHTSKSKEDSSRTKYYPNPSLSPLYQLPEAHTKEPLYVSAKDILNIAATVGALSIEENSSKHGSNNYKQMMLFNK